MVNNILPFKYIANMETFDFVLNERPNIGFSFVLAKIKSCWIVVYIAIETFLISLLIFSK